ncbi:MAG: hypothetical protein ACLFUJ_12600 [Phycisphaerae bacterium]
MNTSLGEKKTAWRIELAALALTLAGLAVSLVMGYLSDGVFHGDDISHYGLAYYSWGDPHKMLHFWARPGYNIPAMFAARLGGMAACRAFSALQTALVAWMAFRIARLVWPARWPIALAPLLVWMQPETMTLSITTLTETTAAVYMAMAVWFWLRRRRVVACLFFSPMFLTRVETMGLVPIIAGGVIGAAWLEAGRSVRKMFARPWAWGCVAALLWAPVAYCAAAWIVDLPADLHLFNIAGREYDDIYGSGTWGHYVVMWSLSIGGGLFALLIPGTMRLNRRYWMLAGMAWGLFALQTIIYRYGLFASGGYGRFMVTVAAPAGALAAGGVLRMLEIRRIWLAWWVWLFSCILLLGLAVWQAVTVPTWLLTTGFCVVGFGVPLLAIALQAPMGRAAGLAAVGMAILANAVQLGATTGPLHGDEYHRATLQTYRKLEQKGLADNKILTTYSIVALWRMQHPEFYSSGYPDQFSRAAREWAQARPGTIFLLENRLRHARQGKDWALLRKSLKTHGRLVARSRQQQAWAEAWIRTDQSAGESASAGDLDHGD